jgi:hypothetical protein
MFEDSTASSASTTAIPQAPKSRRNKSAVVNSCDGGPVLNDGFRSVVAVEVRL